jgi:hypothetical protein
VKIIATYQSTRSQRAKLNRNTSKKYLTATRRTRTRQHSRTYSMAPHQKPPNHALIITFPSKAPIAHTHCMKANKKLETRSRHHKKENLTVATRKQQTVTPDGITSITSTNNLSYTSYHYKTTSLPRCKNKPQQTQKRQLVHRQTLHMKYMVLMSSDRVSFPILSSRTLSETHHSLDRHGGVSFCGFVFFLNSCSAYAHGPPLHSPCSLGCFRFPPLPSGLGCALCASFSMILLFSVLACV